MSNFSDVPAFLVTCLESPADPAPRGALADYLEENGWIEGECVALRHGGVWGMVEGCAAWCVTEEAPGILHQLPSDKTYRFAWTKNRERVIIIPMGPIPDSLFPTICYGCHHFDDVFYGTFDSQPKYGWFCSPCAAYGYHHSRYDRTPPK